MSRKIPTDLVLYEIGYGTEIPIEQLFVFYFDKIPSRDGMNEIFDNKIFPFILAKGYNLESKYSKTTRHEARSESLYILKEKELMIRVYSSNDKTLTSFHIDIYYSVTNGSLDSQFNLEDLKKISVLKTKSNISLVRSEMGHLDTQEYELNAGEMDLELNYGQKFLKVHERIVERLNKPKGKGIILLHGEPGTGKTSYLKHLTKLVKEKDILFIPPSMAETLSEPSIIPFLMDHKDSILVIEDAERVISDRETNGSPAGVSNILNITDGILGDCLNIQVIATFNMKREKIDQALLRKGRLIAEHKFERLDVEETNKLLKSLDKDHVSNVGMNLADIYNIDIEAFKSTPNNTSKIGF